MRICNTFIYLGLHYLIANLIEIYDYIIKLFTVYILLIVGVPRSVNQVFTNAPSTCLSITVILNMQVSQMLGKLYSEMIFVKGFIHCDPHPGNLLVRKSIANGKTEIILLDHGLYQVLNRYIYNILIF